jgi:alkylation response protein AidB-like acyl-CoA dehydrogenase
MELQPVTEAGQRAVEIAEKHAADFATRSDEHDRDGTFPYENWQAMRESGLLGVTIPTEYGGLGLSSAYDFVVTFNRLARGDGSTAIGAMMSSAGGLLLGGAAAANPELTAMLEPMLAGMATGDVILSQAHSEPGTTVPWFLVEGTPVDGGYRVDGRKIFGTNAPVATHFHAFFRAPDGDGGWWTMGAIVARDTPGLTINDDWDALGMRASGSPSLLFTDCFVPAEAAQPFAPWGEIDPGFLIVAHAAITAQAGVFLGIAEAAREWVIDMATTKTKAPSGRAVGERVGIQRAVADMEIELETCRAVVDRHARLSDEMLVSADADRAVTAMRELQCMRIVANRAAINVVDVALQISGGAGYMQGNPLARLYRDVRAGPFMQLYSPNEAYEVIAKAALGLHPTPDL